MAWNGFPGNATITTGFAAAWPQLGARLGSHRAQESAGALNAINTIAINNRLRRFQVSTINA